MNDEYQHQGSWTVLTEPVVVERDKDGKPLMSMQWIMIDFKQSIYLAGIDPYDNDNNI